LQMQNEHTAILRLVDLLLQERAELAAQGPHLTITHRFWVPGTLCMDGEEAFSVSALSYLGEMTLPLSTQLRVMTDYLARHQHVPLTVPQIAAGINSHPWFQRYGANVPGKSYRRRRISRAAAKQQVMRLRRALVAGLHKAGIALPSHAVIATVATDTNELGYFLKAVIKWRHIEY